MAESPDAAVLRQQWNPDALGAYENKWIAFRGEGVERSGAELGELLSFYADEIKTDSGPLFAFVYFGVVQ